MIVAMQPVTKSNHPSPSFAFLFVLHSPVKKIFYTPEIILDLEIKLLL